MAGSSFEPDEVLYEYAAPFPNLRLVCGDVTLKVPTYEDSLILAQTCYDGLFSPDEPSTLGLWYELDDPSARASAVLRHHKTSWALSPTLPLCLPFAVVVDDAVVGVQMMEDQNENFALEGELSTGSWLKPSLRGHGVGTSSRLAVASFAFEGLGMKVLTSKTLDFNTSSRKVSEKCGYRQTGWQVNHSQNESHTLVTYQLNRQEWQTLAHPEVSLSGHQGLSSIVREKFTS
jgi:RimJ/RimL family protein N-acetyltransferase